MSNTKGWLNVEDGSTFELEVVGADTYDVSCVIDGLVVDCAPFPQILRVPQRYQWYLTVRQGKDTASVSARVRKPGGEQHGKPFNCELNGDEGDLAFVYLYALTRI